MVACNDTLAHEFGHTIDLHSREMNPSIRTVANTFDDSIERPVRAHALRERLSTH